MTKLVLDEPRVVACIRQGVAAGVPQHVGVHLERMAGRLADALIRRFIASGMNGPQRL